MSAPEDRPASRSRVAIYHPPGRMGLARNPFGKDVANLALWRAVARHGGYSGVDVLTLQPAATPEVARDLYEDLPPSAEVSSALLPGAKAPAAAGVMLRGQPYLADLAWMRRRQGQDRAYSLVGWIHTLAPPAIRQMIAQNTTAPVHAWDALVCTSPAVRENVTAMLDGWGRHLAERTGGHPPPRPSLPVIPLGVDAAALAVLADRPDVRARVRAGFGLDETGVLILWVGRLSYYEKAFPQPMFKAAAQAQQETGAKVAFVLAGWFPDAKDRGFYEGAARAHAGGAEVRFVDGNDAEAVGGLWAAADVFISLVDNIQETFGITPLEAMAAGLPVVASDWDGYRATVRDGVEGFLIPTAMGGVEGGVGFALAERHVLELTSYQAYAGVVAQHTAVHIGRAAEALAELIRSPDLRRRMGAAGRARVAHALDWPIVARQVRALTDELAEIRARAAEPATQTPADPVRGDPFRTFSHFATAALTLDSWLCATPGVGPENVLATTGVSLDAAFPSHRADAALCAEALRQIQAAGRVQVRDILQAFPPHNRRGLELGLAWMAKCGFVDWLT